MNLRPFDLDAACGIWGDAIGCAEGHSNSWIESDFYGHQIVPHLAPDATAGQAPSPVEGHQVPVPYFGIMRAMEQRKALADRLRAAGVQSVIAPHARFRGQPGEQATMFFRDPAGMRSR